MVPTKLVRGMHGRRARLVASALLALAVALLAHAPVALALSSDGPGVTSLPGFSVTSEDVISAPVAGRGCGGCTTKDGMQGHFLATCLEAKPSCKDALVCECVANKRGVASATFVFAPGTLGTSAAFSAISGAAQLMGAAKKSLLQAYLGKASTLVVTATFPANAVGPTLVQQIAAFTSQAAAGSSDSLLLKVTVDNVQASAIDDELALAPSLASVKVAGPLGCEAEDEDAVVRVTLTQEGSAAIAQGVWRGRCTPADRWTAEARTGADPGASCAQGGRRLLPSLRAPFAAQLAPGEAEACALAEFRTAGRVTRTEQWCNAVELSLE